MMREYTNSVAAQGDDWPHGRVAIRVFAIVFVDGGRGAAIHECGHEYTNWAPRRTKSADCVAFALQRGFTVQAPLGTPGRTVSPGLRPHSGL